VRRKSYGGSSRVLLAWFGSACMPAAFFVVCHGGLEL
jgi:hypothetical protein